MWFLKARLWPQTIDGCHLGLSGLSGARTSYSPVGFGLLSGNAKPFQTIHSDMELWTATAMLKVPIHPLVAPRASKPTSRWRVSVLISA